MHRVARVRQRQLSYLFTQWSTALNVGLMYSAATAVQLYAVLNKDSILG